MKWYHWAALGVGTLALYEGAKIYREYNDAQRLLNPDTWSAWLSNLFNRFSLFAKTGVNGGGIGPEWTW